MAAKLPVSIVITNQSVTVSDTAVQDLVAVLQQQVDNDFEPAWGIRAHLKFDQDPASHLDAWWLGIFDNSDRAGALGYHDVTNAGLPLGKVFAGTAADNGYTWTVTASHELLEMLVDPNIELVVLSPQGYNTFLYAYEICDPCEAEAFAYYIDGTLVSDFVTPHWFEPLRPIGAGPFDFGQKMQAPFQTLPGGHTDVYDVCRCTWRTFWGESRSGRELPEYRDELRVKPRALWEKSTVLPRRKRLPPRREELPPSSSRSGGRT